MLDAGGDLDFRQLVCKRGWSSDREQSVSRYLLRMVRVIPHLYLLVLLTRGRAILQVGNTEESCGIAITLTLESSLGFKISADISWQGGRGKYVQLAWFHHVWLCLQRAQLVVLAYAQRLTLTAKTDWVPENRCVRTPGRPLGKTGLHEHHQSRNEWHTVVSSNYSSSNCRIPGTAAVILWGGE